MKYRAATFVENDYNLVCSVESIGPQITLAEKNKIFLQGFRGAEVAKTAVSGDGLGLYVLKKVIEELYNGTIEVLVNYESSFFQDGITYSKNIFICTFPIVD